MTENVSSRRKTSLLDTVKPGHKKLRIDAMLSMWAKSEAKSTRPNLAELWTNNGRPRCENSNADITKPRHAGLCEKIKRSGCKKSKADEDNSILPQPSTLKMKPKRAKCLRGMVKSADAKSSTKTTLSRQLRLFKGIKKATVAASNTNTNEPSRETASTKRTLPD